MRQVTNAERRLMMALLFATRYPRLVLRPSRSFEELGNRLLRQPFPHPPTVSPGRPES